MPLEGDSRRVSGLGSTKVLLGVVKCLESARLGHLGGPEGEGGGGRVLVYMNTTKKCLFSQK